MLAVCGDNGVHIYGGHLIPDRLLQLLHVDLLWTGLSLTHHFADQTSTRGKTVQGMLGYLQISFTRLSPAEHVRLSESGSAGFAKI